MKTITVTGYFRRPSFLVADFKGYFKREGLDVQFHLIGLCPDHNRELAEGIWPITMSSADTMLARTTQDGVDFVIFLESEQGLDVQLVVQPEIKSFVDLRGKLFAADPVDSNFDLVRNKIMKDNGVAEDEYRIEVIGNSHLRLKAFLDRKVSAAMLAPPSSVKAVEAGGVILAEGEDYVKHWPIVCGWGLRSWVQNNRDTAVQFTRALIDATKWMLEPANKEETIALMMREEKLSRKNAELAYDHAVPDCRIDMSALAENVDLRKSLGYYKAPHREASSFVDETIWQEAVGLTVVR
jgi:ABC-type nitrate/sulfonate/bicarbonate transport system substrate-binding protein